MTQVDDELAAAKARIRELEGQLYLATNPMAKCWPRSFGTPPTDSQLASLVKITQIGTNMFKGVDPDDQEKAAAFFEMCKLAFIGLAWLPRAGDGKLNLKLDKVSFQTRAQDKLIELGIYPNEISLGAFTCAALMHGDVGHSLTPSRWPYDLSFALGNYVGSLPDGTGWRRVLRDRKLLPATALPETGEARLPNHMRPRIGPPTGGAFVPDWAR
jgi:hypothetical protein